VIRVPSRLAHTNTLSHTTTTILTPATIARSNAERDYVY